MIGVQTNMWGGTRAPGAGVTSLRDLYYFSNNDDELAIREAAAAGYRGVELFDGDVVAYRDEPARLAGVLSEHAMRLVAMYVGAQAIYRDAFEDELARIDDAMSVAESFEVPFLVVGAGAMRWHGRAPGDIGALARALDAISDAAARHAMTAVYHPHLGTLSERPEDLELILESTEIRFGPDLGHIAAGGGDPVAICAQYRDRIEYVHLKDYSDGAFVTIGDGVVDFPGVIRALGGPDAVPWWTVELGAAESPSVAAVVNRERAERLLNGSSHG